jgi:Fe-S-cluster formation regulator IscX/YfhJ
MKNDMQTIIFSLYDAAGKVDVCRLRFRQVSADFAIYLIAP